MIKTNEISTNAINIKDVIKGSLLSIITTVILLFIFAILLTYTNISENTIPVVTILITAISILIGSQISTVYIKKNGAINGGLIRTHLYTFSLYYFKYYNRKFCNKYLFSSDDYYKHISWSVRRNNRSKQKIIFIKSIDIF